MSESVPSPFYRRRKTREVRVGDVGVGGGNPIRVQSMTTPRTADVEATVSQILRLVEAGCEIVRVTVPSTADAEALPLIRRALTRHGTRVPLVADIHFSPAAAMMAVEHVEKVRVNPGNYADTKRFKVWEYTDDEYQAELQRIEERFKPLVLRARERGVALRIGTNHGSLSDRILNRYGDTPLGMVESALEFVRICERHSWRELILSMKSSNPMVMIQAYRLLAERMASEGMDYPFHLGVTEAGDGEDGRIKSAVGIGSLLEDGIGDTIRVSLTEDPVAEIPVAFRLAEKYNGWLRGDVADRPAGLPAPPPPAVSTYSRRVSARVAVGNVALGGEEAVRVECLLTASLGDSQGIRSEVAALSGSPAVPEARTEILEVDLGTPESLNPLRDLARLLRSKPEHPALSARIDGGRLARWSDSDLRELAASCDRLTLRLENPRALSDEDIARLSRLANMRSRVFCLQSALPADRANGVEAFVSLAARWREATGAFPVLALDSPP
ncbi:MAG TPA: (E)-4-hydroxy-3-methylbut-2-enyl-diphosphate synthase, partial [Candidatus Polarisedimenticolia bacterium]|nr:(E)-4-hydroxy-3-methylbut-2-enyl-diphosphate synthase [Candidatus Polarisedimenticolia bacterium]